MTENTGKLIAAGALWTAALLLAVLYTIAPVWERGMGVWSVLAAMAANATTSALLLDRHRMKVNHHIALVEAERITREGLRSVR